MNISLAPEKIFVLGHFLITNSIITGWGISVFLLLTGFILRRSLKKIPGRLQSTFELVYEWLFNSTVNIIGREDVARELFPYLITLFLFIVFSNLSGLIPGFGSIGYHIVEHGKDQFVPLLRAPTSDLNTVGALAVISMGYVQYLGLKYAGTKGYLKKFFNFSNGIGFFIGVLELLGEFTRVISFAFRLFGNTFAGEVLISVMLYLTTTLLPYVPILPLPFYFLEIGVAIIQAFIFCFLTIVFVSLAIVSHDLAGHTHGGEELHLTDDFPESPHPLQDDLIHRNTVSNH